MSYEWPGDFFSMQLDRFGKIVQRILIFNTTIEQWSVDSGSEISEFSQKLDSHLAEIRVLILVLRHAISTGKTAYEQQLYNDISNCLFDHMRLTFHFWKLAKATKSVNLKEHDRLLADMITF